MMAGASSPDAAAQQQQQPPPYDWMPPMQQQQAAPEVAQMMMPPEQPALQQQQTAMPTPTPSPTNLVKKKSPGRRHMAWKGMGKVESVDPPLGRPADDKHTLVTMVIDRSGSMASMGSEVVGGCNAYLDECRAGDAEDDSRTTVIFTTFDNTCECPYDGVTLATMPAVTDAELRPRGSTALYDAIGLAMVRTARYLQGLDHSPSVVFFVLTDGKENSSRGWTKRTVTEQITRLQAEPYNWSFYFAAANQDALAEGHSIGMHQDQCITYKSSSKAVSSAWKAQAKAQYRGKKGGCKGYTPEERAECME